jgi:hypothetical protein
MIAQARGVLQLDAERFQAFRPRLQRLLQARRQAQRQRRRVVTELGVLARSASPEAGIVDEKLRQLREADESADRQIAGIYAEIDELLSPRQRARFRVFEARMEDEKLELIMRARQQARGSGAGVAPPSTER